jgi:hypothetical protein
MYPSETTFPYTFTFPVKEMTLETDKLLVVTKGIVSVSKKNTVLTVFAEKEPSTSNVSVTWTFVVVTEFETTKFANG